MATTKASDLIVPEVWGDMIMVTVQGKAVLLPLVTTDNDLVGVPGDEIKFPKYDYIGDADDLTEGVAMTPVKLSTRQTSARIKEAGKAVELTDTAVLTAMGNPDDQARVQLGLSIARKIDKDIRTAAEFVRTGSVDPENPNTSPQIVDGSAEVISWKALTTAFAKFGDEYEPSDLAGIVVHSKQHIDLLNDAKFIDSASFGAGAVILRGQVGAVGTIPVFISDRATVVDNSGTPNYKALIIRKGAIALKYKRRPLVETDRDILARINLITTNVHYAVARVDDRGVVVLTTK